MFRNSVLGEGAVRALLALAATLCASSVRAEEFAWCSGTAPSPPLPSSSASRPFATLDFAGPRASSGVNVNALREFAAARRGHLSGSPVSSANLGGQTLPSEGGAGVLNSLGGLPSSLQIPRRDPSSFNIANLVHGGLTLPSMLRPEPPGLSAASRKLSDDIEALLPPSGYAAAKLAATKESLGTLSLDQQDRIVSIARRKFDGFMVTTPQADAQSSAEQIARLTRAFNLERALGPGTSEAMLGGKLAAVSDDSLIKLSDRRDVRIMGEQVERASTVARRHGWLKGEHIVDVVGPGEAVPPGSLGDVPEGLPVRVVDGGNGKWCKRPAVASDLLLDTKSKMVGQSWDPVAFADVAMLLIRKPGSGVDGISICTAVRVSSGHLLTAAHCLATKGSGDKWDTKSFDGVAWEALALLPKLTVENQKPRQCFDMPASCGFHVSKVNGSGDFPKPMAWIGEVPLPDIGLLKVAFPAASGTVATVAVGKEPSLQQLTLAGYGLTNAGGPTYSGYLQVGWQRRAARLDGGVLIWSVDLDGGFAGACNGDSGGAVFDGPVASKNDSRRLAGLISYGYGTSTVDGIDRCLKMSNGVATRVSRHAKWICDSSSGTALGCTQ